MSEIHVYKFGGASVKDAEGVRNLREIIDLNRDLQLLIVVSAMDKTTNKLEELTDFYLRGNIPAAENTLDRVKAFHENILSELFESPYDPVFDAVANIFVEIEWILEEESHPDEAYVYDQIVSVGELISTTIISAFLNQSGLQNKWADARNYICTDNHYKEGKVDWDRTRLAVQKELPAVLESQFVVTQGFIGGTTENYTTTLGREGSDYSAAIFASCLQAASLTIWKDVAGVLNGDPKLFPGTLKYDELSYIEALEMAYYGATVIHPKTIKPLQNAGIPLIVKPFKSPGEAGTIISDKAKVTDYKPAIIVKSMQVLVSISSKDFSFINEENLSTIFKIFADRHIKINLMQISAISFTVCLDWHERDAAALFSALEKDYLIRYNTDLQLLTVRHYKPEILDELTAGKTILLKQLSRQTAQLVITKM